MDGTSHQIQFTSILGISWSKNQRLCILQLRGLPPFLSPKYDLKKHPNYKYTAEFDKKKNAFRLESLFRHRPLRLKPEDEYTVYEVDGSDTDEEADLLNFDDLDSDEFV